MVWGYIESSQTSCFSERDALLHHNMRINKSELFASWALSQLNKSISLVIWITIQLFISDNSDSLKGPFLKSGKVVLDLEPNFSNQTLVLQ